MGKNIVICLDGTGNQFGEDNSNVVKLFRVIVRDSSQIAYYDPGVGTLADPAYKTPLAKKINKLFGFAFGRGLTQNVIEAYSYLMDYYQFNPFGPFSPSTILTSLSSCTETGIIERFFPFLTKVCRRMVS